MTSDEAARYLDISYATFIKRVKKLEIQPHDKIGASYLWTKNQLRPLKAK
jgi:hypothetical protein